MTSDNKIERHLKYTLQGREVVVPLDPSMAEEDAADFACRVSGVIYERTVTEWTPRIMTSRHAEGGKPMNPNALRGSDQ